MTSNAIRAESEIHACRRVFMAALALNSRVGSPERKPVFVPVRLRFDAQPPKIAMAAFAIASHQAPVNVRMAIAALSADIRENHIGMTFDASQAFVHPLKRVACRVVVEIRR